MARNKKYDPDVHKAWAQKLAMDGLINKEIAKKMNIAVSTLYAWQVEFPEFSDAIKRGKEPADAIVEMNLWRSANGYTYKQKKVIVEMDKEGNTKPARIETTDITVPPNLGSIAFWLKNRKPDEWRERKEVEVSGNPFQQMLMECVIEDENEKEINEDE